MTRTQKLGQMCIRDSVYSASGHDVVMTMVRGQILYNAGKLSLIHL